MNCKSCNGEINTTDKYCSYCGGIVVKERISLSGTWSEFITPIFSWDSNFGKTMIHLFTKPQDVLGGYVGGARNKYFKPFPFLIAYATIALIFYKFFPISGALDFASGFQAGAEHGSDLGNNSNLSDTDIEGSQEFLIALRKSLFEYYNFYILLMLPLMATISYGIFRKYKNNFAEHLVLQAYIMTITGYMALAFQIVFYNVLGFGLGLITNFGLVSSIVYTNYAFIKFYKLNTKSTIIVNLKLFGYLFLVLFVFILLGIVIAFTLELASN